MTWLQSIQSMLPFTGPPERRSPMQIDDDLEEEFAFHLEMKTHDLMGEGHDREAADALARLAFGDLATITTQCKRIATEEHIMLQRINLVIMIIVLVMVVIVGVQVFITQRYNTLALQDITAQIAQMRVNAIATGDAGTSGPGPAQPTGRVLVEGDIANSGWHEISLTDGTTVEELLRRLNVRDDQWVRYKTADSQHARTQPVSYLVETSRGSVLRPQDELRISDSVPIMTQRLFFIEVLREQVQGMQSRIWISIDHPAGEPPYELVFHFVTPSQPIGAMLKRHGLVPSWDLVIQNHGLQLRPSDSESNERVLEGNWEMHGEKLAILLEAATASPAQAEDEVLLPFEGIRTFVPADAKDANRAVGRLGER